ncbi:YfjI family protein [Serratia liquefaciens]|uniref:YfjI family protein n=1 Tax=Serratia liquefaciens TaxID=614 RepID=UPI002158222C|nr:YfjI family protein [Serratia liquefaciens]
MNHFPLKAFPQLLRETILDVHECTQAPVPLIASSVISALSLSCQGLIDIKVNDTVVSPVSLFLLVIANSGERKTTVDRMVLKPLYQHDARSISQSEEMGKDYEIEQQVWNEKQKAILNLIRKKTIKGQCTDELSQRLRMLRVEKPEPPKTRKCIYNNVTPEALQIAMHNHSPHAGLIADEGANVLDRKVMNDLSFINSMWDGVSFHIERKTTPSFTIANGRITLSVMVQKKPFDLYLKRQGERARGSGFFARCLPVLIDERLTTQGDRFIKEYSNDRKFLEGFYQRINEILTEGVEHDALTQRMCLSFEPSAQYAWENIYNEIESRIGPDEEYANMNDFASKLANNVARLAALLSFFSEGGGLVKINYVDSAWLLCEWYMQQAVNIFGNEDGYYETLLLSWLHREYSRTEQSYVKYNDIRRLGPNVLRKGKLLDRVIDSLEREEAIEIDYSRNGARIVCAYRCFDNNPFTKKLAFMY